MMLSIRTYLSQLRRDNSGAVAIEGAVLSGFFIILTGAAIELSVAYWQWNASKHAASVGARIASVSDPVAEIVDEITGLEGEVTAGDPLAPYKISCSGASKSCSLGKMNIDEFDRIVFGPNNDKICESTNRYESGMCDVFSRISAEHITITYESSGIGWAGETAQPRPLITITLQNLPLDSVFLDIFTGQGLIALPDVSVAVLGEDLRTDT